MSLDTHLDTAQDHLDLRHSSRHRTRPSIPHRGDGEGFEANEMGIRLIHGLLFARHVSDQLVGDMARKEEAINQTLILNPKP